MDLAYFVPGQLALAPERGIGRYLPAMPEGVAAAYIAALTQSGDLVLDPFCQTGRVMREAVALDRRALGANLNPIAARWIEAQLWPPDASTATAALVRLGDQPRGEMLLRQHALSLYATRCPTCNKSAVAESFTWDREQGRPVEKTVRCAACRTTSVGPTDEADALAARHFEPRGMAFHFMLERATFDLPPDSDERERATAVVEAYTSRTLTALADILRKFDGMSEPDKAALAPCLLAALEAALALHSAEEERPRPRSLKIPPRFVEHNPWLVMEEVIEFQPALSALPHAPDVAALVAGQAASVCIAPRSARELSQLLLPGSVQLILAAPPQADPTFWALSAVWAAWLLGATQKGAALKSASQRQRTEPLRRLLARRRADMDWLWRGLAQTIETLAPLLAQEGHLVLIAPQADDEILAGLLLAGTGNGLALDHALVEPQHGMRVMWRVASRAGSPVAERVLDAEALATEIGEHARVAAVQLVRSRGEPTHWTFVHAAIQAELEKSGLLRIAAHMPEGAPLPIDLIERATLRGLRAARSPVYPVEDVRGLWWLTDPSRAEPPLADRVETVVYELLQTTPPPADPLPRFVQEGESWTEDDLVAEVYRRFPGSLTPECAYVRVCLESYGVQIQPGAWTLREEDLPAQRASELALLHSDLIALGQRMNCGVAEHEGIIVWSQSAHGLQRPLFSFVLSATAELGAHVLGQRPPHGQPVLVLPGGRGALAHHKLRCDVRLREAVTGAGWLFLKFRQLRNLVAQANLDVPTFQEALGQDPLIEQEGQQMTLL